MKINKKQNGDELIISLEGRLDTTTSPDLEKEVNNLVGVENLTFDFKGLDYISSAGLRVLLATQKVMNKQGKMTVKNVQDAIMEILEVTGFTDILTIE